MHARRWRFYVYDCGKPLGPERLDDQTHNSLRKLREALSSVRFAIVRSNSCFIEKEMRASQPPPRVKISRGKTEKDMKPMKIRPTKHEDIAALQEVVDGTELFPSEMLPHMVHSFLSDVEPSDIWLTCEVSGKAIGFCYAVPEELAEGAWNMLALAVLPGAQGSGYGGAVTKHLEAELKARSQRILIADTSGTEEFARTRAFYRKNGYAEEARIRDFWAKGDDKIVFWKSLI